MAEQSGCGVIVAVAVAGLLLYQCTREKDAAETASSPFASSDQRSDAATDVAADAVGGTTYADQGAPYGCTEDCSGHEAGYAWADENGVTDAADCDGTSQSFIEGCEAYAEAYQSAYEDALEGEE